jgi:myo-inositol-1(or 4)-monophosphatase
VSETIPLVRQLLTLATDAAREASRIHRQGLTRPNAVRIKSTPSDFVSDVDQRAERAVVDMLAAARPHDAVLAEEGEAHAGGSGVRWIIDPLDGTTNYLHGYPAYCVSIAAEVDGAVAVGVVGESSSGTLYSAVRGAGAWRDGEPIAARPEGVLARAIVGTGFSYDAHQRRRQAEALVRIVERVGDVRRSGSAALDLCLLAGGQIDAYFELDLAPWDYSAGRLIAQEAGATVLALPASHGRGPAIVGAHPALFGQFVALLREAGCVLGETETPVAAR